MHAASLLPASALFFFRDGTSVKSHEMGEGFILGHKESRLDVLFLAEHIIAKRFCLVGETEVAFLGLFFLLITTCKQ